MIRFPRWLRSLLLTLILASTMVLLSPALGQHLLPSGTTFPFLRQQDRRPPQRPMTLTRLPLAFVETQDSRDDEVRFQAHGLRGTSLAFTPA